MCLQVTRGISLKYLQIRLLANLTQENATNSKAMETFLGQYFSKESFNMSLAADKHSIVLLNHTARDGIA